MSESPHAEKDLSKRTALQGQMQKYDSVRSREKVYCGNDGSYNVEYTVGISINLSLEWNRPPTPDVNSLPQ